MKGHVLNCLKKIPSNSIDCIVTSPPYWGLRKYPDSANVIWDGDPNCQHKWEEQVSNFCKKCGAWYGQLGLEPTLDLYIEHLLQITKELKRVLKPSGVMFWNHGDSYSGPMGKRAGWSCVSNLGTKKDGTAIYFKPEYKLPRKCLNMQNYRLALRMIEEQGWILRNIIIWYKPNHLPESVKDRFTKSYEPIFMFVKKEKYYFDLDSVREPYKEDINKILKKWGAPEDLNRIDEWHSKEVPLGQKPTEIKKNVILSYLKRLSKYPEWNEVKNDKNSELEIGGIGRFWAWQKEKGRAANPLGKNPGDLWVIPTQPFPEAHFATFPEELVRRCIRAGCPKNGVVLDPFAGSGTTLKVAIEERRNAIGIEIVPEYVEMIKRRINWGKGIGIEYEYVEEC